MHDEVVVACVGTNGLVRRAGVGLADERAVIICSVGFVAAADFVHQTGEWLVVVWVVVVVRRAQVGEEVEGVVAEVFESLGVLGLSHALLFAIFGGQVGGWIAGEDLVGFEGWV